MTLIEPSNKFAVVYERTCGERVQWSTEADEEAAQLEACICAATIEAIPSIGARKVWYEHFTG